MISLRDATKIYKMGETEIKALDSVSLNIGEKEFVSVMGPSGCGKSTLLNIIGCIDALTSGHYFLEGVDVSTLKDRELTKIRLRKIGFIFQQFYLIPTLTAVENIELPMKEAGVPKRRRNERARELLDLVGLKERAKHYPNQLSGGEQQRVAIARALANSPKIILADEPTGELDSKTSRKIIKLLKDLNEERYITAIVVTHNMEIAKEAQKIIRMKDGKIIED